MLQISKLIQSPMLQSPWKVFHQLVIHPEISLQKLPLQMQVNHQFPINQRLVGQLLFLLIGQLFIQRKNQFLTHLGLKPPLCRSQIMVFGHPALRIINQLLTHLWLKTPPWLLGLPPLWRISYLLTHLCPGPTSRPHHPGPTWTPCMFTW